MRPVMRSLRERGFSSVIYLDDILCIESQADRCELNARDTIKLLESLGFKINKKKSLLEPRNKCKFLGFIIDANRLLIELTEEKRDRLEKSVDKFIQMEQCSIQDFAQMIGKLIAACPAIEYGWVYTKKLETEKLKALVKVKGNYKEKMLVPKSILSDLYWWKRNLKDSFAQIKSGLFEMKIYTDASNSGWGAVAGDDKIHGFWSDRQKKWHINYKELYTVKLALIQLAHELQDCQILLRIDNTTAIAYINKMGGVKYSYYNNLAREIWQWAEKRNIFLFATYIASKENYVADSLSRIKNEDTEWELSNLAFEKIINRFYEPEIDLFATRKNSKCKNFCSWMPEAQAMEVDAFTLNWSNLNFYAFPPFSMVLKTLRKIKQDEATGILVVPDWPNQPWYPVFRSMLIEKPLTFEPDNNLLLSSCRSKHHPGANHLSLLVGIVSGKPT